MKIKKEQILDSNESAIDSHKENFNFFSGNILPNVLKLTTLMEETIEVIIITFVNHLKHDVMKIRP